MIEYDRWTARHARPALVCGAVLDRGKSLGGRICLPLSLHVVPVSLKATSMDLCASDL